MPNLGVSALSRNSPLSRNPRFFCSFRGCQRLYGLSWRVGGPEKPRFRLSGTETANLCWQICAANTRPASFSAAQSKPTYFVNVLDSNLEVGDLFVVAESRNASTGSQTVTESAVALAPAATSIVCSNCA